MPDVLILGGTAEARALAARLADDGVPIVSSLAGRVARPRLPVGAVRVGGFGGVDGLTRYLRDERIVAVVDATHPFAARITGNAVAACAAAGVAHLRLVRPPWHPGPADRWTRVPDVATAAATVADRVGGRTGARRILLTTGRQDVSAFAGIDGAHFLIRVVDPPTGSLPRDHEILRSRGPYTLDGERALMRDHRTDLLVTKNSGGELTAAKLTAAAERGVEVIVVDRPAEPGDVDRVDTVDAAAESVRRLVR